MKTWAACTALLALTALAQPALTQATEEAAEEVSTGYLLASKDLDTDYFVAGRNLTIKYTFHNIGDRCVPVPCTHARTWASRGLTAPETYRLTVLNAKLGVQCGRDRRGLLRGRL